MKNRTSGVNSIARRKSNTNIIVRAWTSSLIEDDSPLQTFFRSPHVSRLSQTCQRQLLDSLDDLFQLNILRESGTSFEKFNESFGDLLADGDAKGNAD